MTKQQNDLFFTCSFIEFLGRETKNRRSTVVNTLGVDRIARLYELAEVYHCENILQVKEDFIGESGLKEGDFDNVWDCLYTVPSFWNIGYLYRFVIEKIIAHENATEEEIPSIICSVFNSKISNGIQNFNCAWYYSSPDEIFYEYLEEK